MLKVDGRHADRREIVEPVSKVIPSGEHAAGSPKDDGHANPETRATTHYPFVNVKRRTFVWRAYRVGK
jgi:hypothetical protein